MNEELVMGLNKIRNKIRNGAHGAIWVGVVALVAAMVLLPMYGDSYGQGAAKGAIVVAQSDLQSGARMVSENLMGVPFNAIEDISFEVMDGVGIVNIGTTAPANFSDLTTQPRKIGLKFDDLILPEEFKVSRDVSDFDSPVSFISSFGDPSKPGEVVVMIELKTDAPYDLMQTDNVITLTLGEPRKSEEELAEEVFEQEDEEEFWAFDFRARRTDNTKKDYKGQIVSFDFKQAGVRDVLRILADITGFNFVISSGVKGAVTLKLINVPWDLALDIVLEDKGLGALVEGNVIKVAPLETLNARQRAVRRSQQIKEAAEPLISEQIFINYAGAEQMSPLIKPLMSKRGTIRIDGRTNSILITDTVGRIADVRERVQSLDTITPQVLIEARIVQATLDFTRQLGVQWGANYNASAATGNPTGVTFPASINSGGVTGGGPEPFGSIGENFIVDLPAATGSGAGGAIGLVLGSLTGAFDLDIRLSALERRGDGRILSSPKVLTLDNRKAKIEQGVSIPFLSVSSAGTQTQFVDATLRLEVTPHVTNDQRIQMTVKITDNAPDPSLQGANGQPSIRRNEAETRVLARDGETIVIGGIFTRTVSENLAGIPWFSKIPILGFLFRNDERSDERRELMVFITPRIIR